MFIRQTSPVITGFFEEEWFSQLQDLSLQWVEFGGRIH